MADKETIRKALEIIAGENKINLKTPNKLFATKKKLPELETENGLFKVGMDHTGTIEITSKLGPKITIIPTHIDNLKKALCPEGAIYEIKTSYNQGDGYFQQPGICYVTSEGLVIENENNIKIRHRKRII